MNTFIQQGHIKLIESGRKDVHYVIINSISNKLFILTLYLSKFMWKKCIKKILMTLKIGVMMLKIQPYHHRN